MSTTQVPQGRTERRRARRMCYGAVGLLLAWAVTDLDFWPMTSYRLFSEIRTDRGTSTELIAVFDDGSEHIVSPQGEIPATTRRAYTSLPDVDADERGVMLGYWFAHSGIDADDVDSVRLERSERVVDPASLEWTTLASEQIWEADL